MKAFNVKQIRGRVEYKMCFFQPANQSDALAYDELKASNTDSRVNVWFGYVGIIVQSSEVKW